MKQPPKMFLTNLVTKICDEELSEKAVMSIIHHYPNQIRFQKDGLSIKAKLIITIPQVAKEYGARHEISTHLLTECIRLILKKFRFLAVAEIREAYRMWASGDIQIKGAEMYGGEFNAMQMGKVLSAYLGYRKPVLAKVLDIKTEMEEAADRSEKNRIAKEEFEIQFPKTILAARETITKFSEVVPWWYDSALKRGYFTITIEQKREIWKSAKHLAAIEKEARKREERFGKLQIVSMDATDIAVRISQQMVVFEKIIQNPDFKIPKI